MKRLSIVILSFNTKDYLYKCLQSIFKQAKIDWEIVVVDNASSDGSIEMVERSFPQVKIIQNNKNIGFAAGNNVALRAIESEYVMLMNADAELLEGEYIEKLLKYLDEHKDIGILTPKIVMPNGNMDKSCHRGIPTPWNGLTYFSGLEKIIGSIPGLSHMFGGYHQLWKNMDQEHEVDVCSAAAMVVRTQAMKLVGLLDERYFFYAEDIDWCVSFKEKGWKVFYYPQVKILHYKWKAGQKKKAKTDQEKEIQKRAKSMFFDTMEEFYRKHYAKTYPKWFMEFVLFGIRTVKKMKGA